MPQTFKPGAVLAIKLAGLAFGLLVLAGVLMLSAWTPNGQPAIDEVRAQPVPFSHKHHVGDVGLDCRFCHVSVETSARPGMPSAQLCLTCHSQLFADQAMLAPLHRREPIAWVQINRLPDYVYFDHSIHLAKGVACFECHGRIDQQPLTQRVAPLTMKWCIACHENPRPRLHRHEDLFSMPPPLLDEGQRAALNRVITLEHRQRLTDCSTCHR